MEPFELGLKYDNIASWWNNQHEHSSYGMSQLKRAIKYSTVAGKALDVGCGAGGRFVRELSSKGFSVTGIDVSTEMIRLATNNHPNHAFIHADICSFQTSEKYDFIIAWDSIFHLPLMAQKPVITKLCALLAKNGVLIYTFGNSQGEHIDQWKNDTFYYSSIGIQQNIQLLMSNNMSVMHLELDQYPEKHAYIIACKS